MGATGVTPPGPVSAAARRRRQRRALEWGCAPPGLAAPGWAREGAAGQHPSTAGLDIGDILDAMRRHDSWMESVSDTLRQMQEKEAYLTEGVISLQNEMNTRRDTKVDNEACMDANSDLDVVAKTVLNMGGSFRLDGDARRPKESGGAGEGGRHVPPVASEAAAAATGRGGQGGSRAPAPPAVAATRNTAAKGEDGEEETVQHFDLANDDEEDWEREYFPVLTKKAARGPPGQLSASRSAPLSSDTLRRAGLEVWDDDALALPELAYEIVPRIKRPPTSTPTAAGSGHCWSRARARRT